MQEWLGNNFNPSDWGWRIVDGLLMPFETELPVAPENLLNMISCRVYRTKTCANCFGQTCNNYARHIDDDDDDDDDGVQVLPSDEDEDEEGVVQVL